MCLSLFLPVFTFLIKTDTTLHTFTLYLHFYVKKKKKQHFFQDLPQGITIALHDILFVMQGWKETEGKETT